MSALADIKARTEGHARGPWEIRADHGESPAVWHDSETAFSIGRCADCGVEAVYAPADAELIAAAPKLLAALEAVLILAEQWRYKGEFGGGAWQEGHGPDPEGAALDDASAALRGAILGAFE
ncbi:hypothetical protein [Arthrobacter sp. Z1-15]